MIDEGLWMAQHQLVVAGRRADAPVLGLHGWPGVAEHASEAGRVLGVIAGRRERTQAVDGGVPGTQGRVDLGEVTERRGVGRHPAHGGVEPGTGSGRSRSPSHIRPRRKSSVGDRERRNPR